MNQKPGMVQSPRGCLPFILWGVVGAGVWAAAIAIGIAVARRVVQ